MPHAARAILLAALIVPTPLRAAAPPAGEPALAQGIQQVQEGDFEGAVATLQEVTRRLAGQPARPAERAQAHLYLGIAHVALDQPAEAKASFKAALAQNKELRLTPDRFSPKVIAAFEGARREMETASAPAARGGGGGKPLVWVALGGAAAAGVAIAASSGGGGGGGNGPVRLSNARFETPVIVCPNGAVELELPYRVLVDVNNGTDTAAAVTAVEMTAVIEASPQLPSEVGFSSRRPSQVEPSSVPARTTATLRVRSSLLCGNGAGDPARSNTWLARLSFNTSAGPFTVETSDRMRVDVP